MSEAVEGPVIMIVDDEPDNLNVLGEMLRIEGLDIRAFPRGDLALAAAREEPPDLVLLDIGMPDMNGIEVCRRFKTDESLRGVPIIFLSAFANVSEKVRAFKAGGVDYVTKPFAEVEVLARTRAHLRLRRHQLDLEDLVRERVSELAEAHRRLRVWDDAKNQWLHTLAHEMRTPLTGVFAAFELLFRELPETPDNRELHEDFESSRRRIVKLIDDAVTLQKIDVASECFEMFPVPLGKVIDSVLERLAQEDLQVDTSDALAHEAETVVVAEQELLERALCDLLRTAWHGVTADERVTFAADRAAGSACLTIATRGEPLSDAALETFFEVGGQRALVKHGGDFGLGAALARHIIRLFRGKVSVRNRKEGGILIEVFLPVVESVAGNEERT